MEVKGSVCAKDDVKLTSFHDCAKDASKNREVDVDAPLDDMLGDNFATGDGDEERASTRHNCDATHLAAGNVAKSTGRHISWLQSLMAFCSHVSIVGVSYVVNTSASSYRRLV